MKKKWWLGLVSAGAALFSGYRYMRNRHHILMSDAGDQASLQIKNENPAVWTEYPRPQMKRAQWMSLNGVWDCNGQRIVVPFPPQSELSGYRGHVGAKLVYRRSFTLPRQYEGKKILLHFGAVDQVAEVYVNEQRVAMHEGGYLAWTVDITEAVRHGRENELRVAVTDTLSHDYPYGKQRKKRGGMWYTPVSGIWQSVWIEAVPKQYISSMQVKPDLKGIWLKINVDGCDEEEALPVTVRVTLSNGKVHTWQEQSDLRTLAGDGMRIELAGTVCADGHAYEPHLWSPKSPYLYPMRVTVGEDTVESYFALRTVEIREAGGVQRVCLNGEPVFLHGVLDQGYYPEGIYLPGDEREYERDILRMKELGICMLRKHIKIEPECFYYDCDRHGMLVMQDMVNSGTYSFIRDTALPMMGFVRANDRRRGGSLRRKQIFEQHMKDTLTQLYNHPCIIAYTIFNEGWGQFDSDRMYETARSVDDSRLYDATSGWFRQKLSDFESRHVYFKTVRLPKTERPLIVSECGGYAYTLPAHRYSRVGHYGYGECRSRKELTDRIVQMYEKMILPAIGSGACGCVYTQLCDVEDETNGFYTYDRKICKVDAERMRQIAARINETLLQEQSADR
ncbi:MAG: glycoside hydrolase family 2 [bacterium]|nr:glycoside hydrolase family 2 [bacterium]